jgi:hypothetical protein
MTVFIWIVLTGIYMLGYWTLYFLFRYLIKDKMQVSWTLQERLIGLVFSLVSWVGLLFYAIVYVLGKNEKINLNKVVKW